MVKEVTKKETEDIKEKVKKETKYNLSVMELLESGVHFGHKKATRNPKMNPYIFGVRRGVNIINLEKTIQKFQEALGFIEQLVEKNGRIILVGTKKQAKALIKEAAEETKMPYVNERWIGGAFTNFKVISKRLKYLKEQKEIVSEDKLSYLTKLEKSRLNKEVKNMESRMGGLLGMTQLPEAIFVLDIDKDQIAVREAQKQGIKVVALVDTNNDPDGLDYFIPANNDALSSLRYILGIISQKINEAQEKNISRK
ncbi:MAG: 30S ribosomal protein S2 [Candidatus Moranbacteria bacterium]|nr:30S ribosomal protein S2 [Candidatus Moranbacteria bacterium]